MIPARNSAGVRAAPESAVAEGGGVLPFEINTDYRLIINGVGYD